MPVRPALARLLLATTVALSPLALPGPQATGPWGTGSTLGGRAWAADDEPEEASAFDTARDAILAQLEADDRQGVSKVFKGLPVDDDPGFIEWFEANAPNFPPEYLYAYVAWLYGVDPDRAGLWAPLARMRLINDFLRCTDPTVNHVLVDMDQTIFDVVEYLKSNEALYVRALEWALDWDRANPPPDVGMDVLCKSGVRGLEMAEIRAERLRVAREEAQRDGRSTENVTIEDPFEEVEWIHPDDEREEIRNRVRETLRRKLDAYRRASDSGSTRPGSGG